MLIIEKVFDLSDYKNWMRQEDMEKVVSSNDPDLMVVWAEQYRHLITMKAAEVVVDELGGASGEVVKLLMQELS